MKNEKKKKKKKKNQNLSMGIPKFLTENMFVFLQGVPLISGIAQLSHSRERERSALKTRQN